MAVFIPASVLYPPALSAPDGRPQLRLRKIFALVIVGTFCLSMCRLALRHCLGYLASRIPSSKVPLLVLCVSVFFVLCLFLLRLRWLRGWMMRGFLWLPSAVLPRLRFSPHIRDFHASFGEFCSCLGNFSACTFAPLTALVVWPFSSVCLSYA